MRRGSLVGPLLIILVGVWFLMSTLRPDLPLLDIAARFWPWLLICWGALRAVEILLWAVRGKPLPYAGISGGEWTLIVFVCLIGSGLYTANRYRPWKQFGFIRANRVEIFGHGYDYSVADQTAPAPKAARVLIENLRGNVRVTGADVTEVKVGGRKNIRALQEADADGANKQTPVEISSQGDQLVIRTNQDRMTGEERISTDLEVTVPRSASVEVRGRYGDLEISDLNGRVEISSDNAGVRLQNIGAAVHVDVRKSDIVRATNIKGSVEVLGGRGSDLELDTIAGEVTVNGSFSGDLQFRNCEKWLRLQSPQTDLRVEKLPGQIHMDLGEFSGSNLVGPIRLTTSRSRDVQIERFTQALELNIADRGDITLRPGSSPLPKIEARTHIGQIELALPEAAQFELKATSSRGELNNDFGPMLKTEFERQDHPNSGGAIVGAVGKGPALVVATDRGSITIRKDTGESVVVPHPPKPPVPPTPPDKVDMTIEKQ